MSWRALSVPFEDQMPFEPNQYDAEFSTDWQPLTKVGMVAVS
jgi:hypothetical protein